MEVIIYAIILIAVVFIALLCRWGTLINEPSDLNDADRYNDTDLLQEQINDQQIFMQP